VDNMLRQYQYLYSSPMNWIKPRDCRLASSAAWYSSGGERVHVFAAPVQVTALLDPFAAQRHSKPSLQ